mmetsp:Transcript_27623/g.79353  ORF Transcript_27623/g.79353 Transcript_27623/m.79353 type:complete len:287 (+) Transcript_27623:1892-2752(+)
MLALELADDIFASVALERRALCLRAVLGLPEQLGLAVELLHLCAEPLHSVLLLLEALCLALRKVLQLAVLFQDALTVGHELGALTSERLPRSRHRLQHLAEEVRPLVLVLHGHPLNERPLQLRVLVLQARALVRPLGLPPVLLVGPRLLTLLQAFLQFLQLAFQGVGLPLPLVHLLQQLVGLLLQLGVGANKLLHVGGARVLARALVVAKDGERLAVLPREQPPRLLRHGHQLGLRGQLPETRRRVCRSTWLGIYRRPGSHIQGSLQSDRSLTTTGGVRVAVHMSL